MKLLSRFLFGLLVVATVAAFFVAQRIKSSPSIIQAVKHPRVISPNGDGTLDSIGFSLRLKEPDRVTLTIVDSDGDPVRRILDDRKLRAYESLRGSEVRWDGRDDDGNVVADGRYRLRITLRDLGRTAVDQKSIVVDTKPPRPLVKRVEPADGGPAVLPRANGGSVTAVFSQARNEGATISVYETSPVRRRILTEPLEPGETQWVWDGTVNGTALPSGTYVIVPSWRDKAGNVGTSVPLAKDGLPVDGRPKLPGKGGVTIRYVAVSPPRGAVKAGTRASFSVDARGERYGWSLSRFDGQTIKRGKASRSSLTIKIPRANAGLYRLRISAGGHVSSAPFVVNGTATQGGSADDPRGVLVIAPAITWQGRNAVDDDGDGAPNLLDTGATAQLLTANGHQRAFAGDGLPVAISTHEAQIFKWLDDNEQRYDVATDIELESDPSLLRGYRGVVLAGDTRWLTQKQRSRIKRFVRNGGTLLSVGTDSLRRVVDYSASDGRLSKPSKPAATDLFGAQIGRRQAEPTGLENFGDDRVGLFSRSEGAVAGVTDWEQTLKVGDMAEQVASAVTADTDPPGKTVTIAVTYGKGLVIRPGFDSFSPKLNSDSAVGELMDGAWALLSR